MAYYLNLATHFHCWYLDLNCFRRPRRPAQSYHLGLSAHQARILSFLNALRALNDAARFRCYHHQRVYVYHLT